MRRVLAAILILLVWSWVPWRVIGVCLEMPFVSNGHIRLISGNDHYWDAISLQDHLTQLGWTVTYLPLDDDIGGYTIPDSHEVQINEHLSWNERYSTLAHEAGHTMQPPWGTGQQHEVFAELVSTVITGVNREHARYLTRMKIETLLVALTEWRRVYRVADLMQQD